MAVTTFHSSVMSRVVRHSSPPASLCPVPDIGSTISHTIDNIPIHFIQCITHNNIGFPDCFLFRILLNRMIAAMIIFEIIYSPSAPSPLHLFPHADNCPDNHHMLSVPVKNKYRISILGMNIISRAFKIREFLIREQLSLLGAFGSFPAVINVHIRPSVCMQLFIHHAGSLAHFLIIYRKSPAISTVPSIGGVRSNPVSYFQGNFFFGYTFFVHGFQKHFEISSKFGLSRNKAGGSI